MTHPGYVSSCCCAVVGLVTELWLSSFGLMKLLLNPGNGLEMRWISFLNPCLYPHLQLFHVSNFSLWAVSAARRHDSTDLQFGFDGSGKRLLQIKGG